MICILWSRLGTRQPPELTRPDGSRYNSGTEYEFEEAWRSFQERGQSGLLVCWVWRANVTSFQQLSRAKFQVIHELEKQLPYPCYAKEWEILGQGADRGRYFELTRVEKALPLTLTIPYLVLLLIAISFLTGIT